MYTRKTQTPKAAVERQARHVENIGVYREIVVELRGVEGS